MKEHIVYLALGSNLGNRPENLKQAIASLTPQLEVKAKSQVYETPPWGYEDQPKFLNQVIRATTYLDPERLLKHLKRLEVALRVSPEDLETALTKRAEDKVRLDDSREVDEHITAYLKEHFMLRVVGEKDPEALVIGLLGSPEHGRPGPRTVRLPEIGVTRSGGCAQMPRNEGMGHGQADVGAARHRDDAPFGVLVEHSLDLVSIYDAMEKIKAAARQSGLFMVVDSDLAFNQR